MFGILFIPYTFTYAITQTTPKNNKIMTRFFKIISITGQEFLVRPNFNAKIFTIKKNGTTYKTLSMTESGFNKCLRYTGNDWANFFTNEYYLLTIK